MAKQRKEIWIKTQPTGVGSSYPKLSASVCTMIDMRDRASLETIERILDDSPIADIARIDSKEPIRHHVSQFSGNMTLFLEKQKQERAVSIMSTSGVRTPFTTRFELMHFGPCISVSGRDSGYSKLNFDLSRKNLSDDDIENFKKLFIKIANATDAFYGACTEDSIHTQYHIFLIEASWQAGGPQSRMVDFEIEIRDVYWLNYFGAGYVEFWGREKVDALAKAYHAEHFDNGGAFIQATKKPVFADFSAEGITVYDWKQAFYDILGRDTFMYETQKKGLPGQYVPTLECHRSIIRRVHPNMKEFKPISNPTTKHQKNGSGCIQATTMPV